MLTQLSLFHFLPTLPNILRHGADAGIHPISQVHAPRNSKSLEQNSDVFLALVLHEFKQERYFGPFDEQETIRAVRGLFSDVPRLTRT